MTRENKSHKNEIRINTLENKIGINKDGIPTGNGITGEIKSIKQNIDTLDDKLNKITAMQIEIDLRFDILDSSIKELSTSLKTIQSEMKDNINFRTIATAKNIFIGLAGVITALGIIGVAITKIVSLFKE